MTARATRKPRPPWAKSGPFTRCLRTGAAREGLIDEGCTKVSAWVPLGYERALRFHDLAGFKREMTSIKTVPLGAVKIEEIRFKRDLM